MDPQDIPTHEAAVSFESVKIEPMQMEEDGGLLFRIIWCEQNLKKKKSIQLCVLS